MITGHLGVALALRTLVTKNDDLYRRRWVLPALSVASVFPDIADLVYAAAKFCSPLGLYSHALSPLFWLSLVAFVLGWVIFVNGKVAALLALAVASHLLLDFVTGEKLLWPGGPVVGLVLYEYPVVDFLLELPILIGGWWILRRTGNAREAFPWATSKLALVALISFQAALDTAKLTGSPGKPSGCSEEVLRRR